MKTLTILPYSDDVVGYVWNGISAQVGTPMMGFTVTLPDGSRLPIVADYNNGWEFRVELPDGAQVVTCDLWEKEGELE